MVSTVAVGTNGADVLALFANEDIRLVDAEGNVVADGDTVATGYCVQLVNGKYVTEEARIIVPGDVWADGVVNVLDMECIQKDILQIKPLESIYYEAGRLTDGEEKLSILDMEAIQKKVSGLD